MSLVGPWGLHSVQMFFTRRAPRGWDVHAFGIDRDEALRPLGAGSLEFDADGRLETADLPPFQAPWSTTMDDAWRLVAGVPLSEGGSGLGTTSYGAASVMYDVDVDGVPPRPIAELGLSPRGEVFAIDVEGEDHTLAWILDGLDARLVAD